MRTILKALAIPALALIATPSFAVTNLLTNGSFENGFAGWTLDNSGETNPDGIQSYPPVVIEYNSTAAYPVSAFGEAVPVDNAMGNPSPDAPGTHGAYFVSDYAHPQTLYQSVTLLANTSYTFGFDLYKPANGSANLNDATFSASLAGTPFASFMGSQVSATTWQTFSGAYTFNATTSGDFKFSFTSFGNPGKDFVIDRVYLAATSSIPGAVPEPASWALMVVGFGALGSAMRRRRPVTASTI